MANAGPGLSDPEISELAARTAKSLRVALANSRIYPAGSTIMRSSLEGLLDPIAHYLETHEIMVLMRHKERLMLEKQAVLDAVADVLAKQHVDSLTFRRGLTTEELSIFIQLLAGASKAAAPGQPLDTALTAQGVTHLTLNQTVFVAVGKDETVVKKFSDLVGGLAPSADVGDAMTAIRQSFDLLDQMTDAAERADSQQALVEKVAQLSPAVLRDIFERELPGKIEQSGLKDQILGELGHEKIEDIFGEITKWYHDLKMRGDSDFAAVEKLGKLKVFLNHLLNAPAAQQVPFHIFEELMQVGVLEHPPGWLPQEVQEKLASPVYQVEAMLAKDATVLLEPPDRDLLPEVAKKLCQADLDDHLSQLTLKILETLDHPAAVVRQSGVDVLGKLLQTYHQQRKDTLVAWVESKIVLHAGREKQPGVLSALAEVLRQRIVQKLSGGETDGALALMTILKKHAVEGDEKTRSSMKQALASVAGSAGDLLVADIRSGDPRRQSDALKVAAKLELSAVEPLLRILKETEDARTRQVVAQVILGLGPAAVQKVLALLSPGTPTEIARRIIETLPEFGDGEIVSRVEGFLPYANLSLKRDILRYLSRMDSPRAESALGTLMGDTEPAIRQEAVRLAGEKKLMGTAPRLLELAEDLDPKTQEEACIALGRLASRDGLPVLSRLLKPKSRGLFGLGAARPGAPESVRMRAAWAIGQIGGPESKPLLEEAARDSSPVVQSAARDALGPNP